MDIHFPESFRGRIDMVANDTSEDRNRQKEDSLHYLVLGDVYLKVGRQLARFILLFFSF